MTMTDNETDQHLPPLLRAPAHKVDRGCSTTNQQQQGMTGERTARGEQRREGERWTMRGRGTTTTMTRGDTTTREGNDDERGDGKRGGWQEGMTQGGRRHQHQAQETLVSWVFSFFSVVQGTRVSWIFSFFSFFFCFSGPTPTSTCS